ncbi:hypothetical protein [Parapedobacter tibetensis]|uniref:hypothetical protein n=1 Tax=Parapedobacter tibetensis TaxID=2972951 RepID=UPI00214D8BB2|nr:hypothetical protein [Parapedobacter tibetensis]
MIRKLIPVLALFVLALGLAGCKKENETRENRHYRYEVTGTISKQVMISYTPTILDDDPDLDNIEYEETVSLPWIKEVTLNDLVQGIGCSISVDYAVPGQEVFIKIYLENELVATHEGVVDANGSMAILVNYYIDGTVNRY